MRHVATFTVQGNMPRKSNSRQIAFVSGHPAVIKSADALAWQESAQWQMPRDAILDGQAPVLLVVTAYYASRRSDLSLELLQDVMQGFLYPNDRQVVATIARRRIDRDFPRVEVSVYVLDAEAPQGDPWPGEDHAAWAAQAVGRLAARDPCPDPFIPQGALP